MCMSGAAFSSPLPFCRFHPIREPGDKAIPTHAQDYKFAIIIITKFNHFEQFQPDHLPNNETVPLCLCHKHQYQIIQN